MELIKINNLGSSHQGSNSMAPSDTLRQPLINTEYEPVSSSHKLNLLLQRSFRYSYRQTML